MAQILPVVKRLTETKCFDKTAEFDLPYVVQSLERNHVFNKASIYVIADIKRLDGLAELLGQAKFLPVDSGLKSFGWAPVRGDELLMSSHGHQLLNFTIEAKVIPPSALKLAVQAHCDECQKNQGFAPGKVQRKEIKEQVAHELCARALARRVSTAVWIDTVRGRLIIDSSTVGTLDLIISSLVKLTNVELVFLPAWAGAEMNDWLLQGEPDDYTVDDAIQMEYPGERGTIVAFKKADLVADAVHVHAAAGAIVTKMALTYRSRLSFVLAPIHQITNIRLLDVTKENQVAKDADEQENNFVLIALELQALIDSLSEEKE